MRGCISYQRGNILCHTPQIWRPPGIGGLELKAEAEGNRTLDLTSQQQTLTSKPLRLQKDGSDKVYKSCHFTLQHGVPDVEESFEDNYYRAVEMASNKDKQPWQLIKIHGMGPHEHIGDQSPFDLSTMHLTKEQFFNFCCDNIMDFNPTTWHSYMPVIKDVLLMDDDEEADLEHFVTGA